MARKSRKYQTELEMDYSVALYIRTALYLRLSVEDREKLNNSIGTQQMVLESYLSGKPEFEVHEVYIDNGCSGTNFQRPAFQRMLADIEDGKVNCVIVKDLSRLGRNAIDTGFYIEQYFPAHKVRFISVADSFDSEHPDNLHGGIILPLKNMINEAYAQDIARKVGAQQRQAMKDGEYVGARALYGYRKDPENCHRLLVDEEAAVVIRQIFQWAYEKAGINDIVLRLNEAGIATPSHYMMEKGIIRQGNLVGSGAWQTWTVAKILRTEIYTGVMVQGKTKTVDHRQGPAGPDNLIVVPGTHEAIISQEMFEAVRAYREEVAEECRQRGVESYSPNILKGKVFCAHCGRPLHRQRAKRRTMPDVYRYHCLTNSRVKKGGCAGVSITEHKLLPVLKQALRDRLAVVLEGYVGMLRGEADRQRWMDEMDAALSQARLRVLRDRKSVHELYDNLERGVVCEDEFQEIKARRDAGISAATAEISRLEKGIAALKGQMVRYEELRRALGDLNRSRHLSAALVDFLVERIDIAHDHEITLRTRFEDAWEAYGEVWKQCVDM